MCFCQAIPIGIPMLLLLCPIKRRYSWWSKYVANFRSTKIQSITKIANEVQRLFFLLGYCGDFLFMKQGHPGTWVVLTGYTPTFVKLVKLVNLMKLVELVNVLELLKVRQGLRSTIHFYFTASSKI